MTFSAGNRVALYKNMNVTGTVLRVEQQKSNQMMEGGSMQALWLVIVQLDLPVDGHPVMSFRADSLRKIGD